MSAFTRALEASAVKESLVADYFHGDTVGSVIDPFGYRWRLSPIVENLPVEEIERRMHAREY